MSRGTPEETFAEARGAMERGDWEGVFVCLDPADVARIAGNTFARFLTAGGSAADTLLQICTRHGISEATLTDLRGRGRAIIESAQLPMAPPGPAMLEQSKRHQQFVKAYQQAKEDALGAVADLPAFTAAMERAVRADGSGGSVSSTLFVGETLEQVSIEGAKAWGTRRLADSATEDVGFVRRKTSWYIRLFARRR
jgi:hypothetical protein